jgi:hypothetical protein
MPDGISTHADLLSSGNPLWFASEELLTDLLRDEIHLVTQLFARHPDLREFFDLPEASVEQRAACFAVLAHRTLMELIYETFTGRYQPSPSLGDEENDVLRRTQGLVAPDAPAWVLEVDQVAGLLPSRIFDALPEPLRRGGFHASDPAHVEVIRSAATELSCLQEIQALSRKVLDQQLRRLESRWSTSEPVTNLVREIVVREQKSNTNKPKNLRTPDKQRIARDKLIFQIEDAAPTIHEFVKLMDERKVPPQLTWSGWPGSWSKAYKDPRLRKLIHQDKSRALARVRRERQR